ncbi:MAG: autotransporter outer membrane beta-barrel domain-containing protein, partial [Planctomycetota bacterium]
LFAAALLTDAESARPVLRGLTAARAGGLGEVSHAGASAVRRTAFRALRPGGGAGGLFRGQSDDLAALGGGANDEFGCGSFSLGSVGGIEESADSSPGVRTADVGDSDSQSGVERASFTPGGRAARSSRGGFEMPWGGFAEGYVVGGEIGSGAAETEYLSGGAVFGIDRLVSPGTRVGVLFGFGGAGSDNDGGVERFEADVDSWQIGLYGTKTAGRWHTATAAVYGRDRYDTTRTVVAGGQPFVATGETDGGTVTLAVESGYRLPIEWLDLQPLAGLQYVHSTRDGYQENGLGAANLLFGDASSDSLRLQLGARASKTLGDPYGVALIPELRAWWFGELSGADSAAPVRFAAAPTLPAFAGAETDNPGNQWVLGGGLTGVLGPHIRLYAHYDLLLGEDALSHAGTGGAELRW